MTGTSLDRPSGLAPKGSSWGLGLISLYAPAVPGLLAMAIAPWLPGGPENGLPFALAGLAPWMVTAVPLIIGFKSRRYWGVLLFFYVGVCCAVALPLSIVVLAGLILTNFQHPPDQFYDVWFGVGLIAMLPFWPRLVRTLRLKYWQPWTNPSEWETGDERIANWVFDAAGAPRRPPLSTAPNQPSARAQLKAGRGRRRR